LRRRAGEAAGPVQVRRRPSDLHGRWQEGSVLAAWEAVKYFDRQVNPTVNR
jgi:hypothetical protein